MNRNRIFKRLALCPGLVFAFFILFTGSGYAQKHGIYTRGDWQTSFSPAKWVGGKSYAYTGTGRIKIGVRDKYGASGGYTASFVVTAPNKSTYKFQTRVKGDDWGDAVFPFESTAPTPPPGIYSVQIYVKKQLVVAFKFKYTHLDIIDRQ